MNVHEHVHCMCAICPAFTNVLNLAPHVDYYGYHHHDAWLVTNSYKQRKRINKQTNRLESMILAVVLLPVTDCENGLVACRLLSIQHLAHSYYYLLSKISHAWRSRRRKLAIFDVFLVDVVDFGNGCRILIVHNWWNDTITRMRMKRKRRWQKTKRKWEVISVISIWPAGNPTVYTNAVMTFYIYGGLF